MLYKYIESEPVERPRRLAEWNRMHTATMTARNWSDGQKQAMDMIRAGIRVCDANSMLEASRWLYLSGEPGAGKSEVIVHAAAEAATAGYHVLILCPTGSLVHSYKDRLPDVDNIVVETLHSGFAIYRGADEASARYSPPTRLRRYDLFLVDEGSQIEDHVAKKVYMGIKELAQKPFVCIAADFQQLNPIAGGGFMRALCADIPCVELKTIYRTSDPELLSFLSIVRKEQPAKSLLRSFFRARLLSGSLRAAVAMGLRLSQEHDGMPFAWLCVTNKGASKVNEAALSLLDITEAELDSGYAPEPKIGGSKIILREGLCIRLTRNLDKPRGFVNGAIGVVMKTLCESVAILRLTTGNLVLLHPVSADGEGSFLPCTYGYATTIRRAQGSSLGMGCVYFDHCYPPERGYGYVGASRFRAKEGLYHYGRLRRTDWLPVGKEKATEQTCRGDSSQESDEWDEEQRELDEAYASSDDDDYASGTDGAGGLAMAFANSDDEDYASGAEGPSGLAMAVACADDGAVNSVSALLSRF